MKEPRSRPGLAVVLVILASVPGAVHGFDRATWQTHMDAAERAEREGRIEDAEASLVAAAQEAERAGPARMLLARSVEARADLYYRQGRHDDAEPLFLRSIALWEDVLGPSQPRVGIPVHNLAVQYLEHCRVDEALPLVHRVLDLWKRTLGPDHRDRQDAIRTEATLLRRCGRTTEAVSLEEQLASASPPS